MRSILELVVDEQSHKLISCASEVALGEDFLIKFSGESKLLGERLIGATAMVTMTCNLDLVYRTTKEVLTCVKFDDPSALGELNVGDVYIVPDKIWTRQAARAVQNGYAQAYVGLTITYKDGRRVEFGTAITILHRGYADDGQSYLELLADVEEHNEDELAHPKLRKLIEDEKTGLRAEVGSILEETKGLALEVENSRNDAKISATSARESAASAKDAYDKLSPALDNIDANVGKVQEEVSRALNYLMDCEFLADKAAKASESAYRCQVESSRSAIDASKQNGYATEAATNASIDASQARSYSNLAEKYCNDANASKLACKNALNECNSAMFEAQDWASEASGHEVKARDYAIEDYWNKYDNKSGYVQDTSKVTAVYNEDRSRVIYTTRVALFVDPQIVDINLFVRMIWIQISGYSINSSVEATDFEIVDAHTTDDKGFIGYSVVCKATFESSMGTSGTPMAILRVTSAKNYYYLMKDSTEGAIEARDEAVAAKNEAVASAMLASASASSASESASSANTSATTASASASSAVASASVATAGANAATTKANEASASASTASASATTATAKASEASASATTAVQAASTATMKASEAAASAESVAGYTDLLDYVDISGAVGIPDGALAFSPYKTIHSNDTLSAQNYFAICSKRLELVECKTLSAIEKAAFWNCANLSRVNFTTNSLKNVGVYSFCDCKKLTLENVQRIINSSSPGASFFIGDYAFQNCATAQGCSGEELVIPSYVIRLNTRALASTGITETLRINSPSCELITASLMNASFKNLIFCDDFAGKLTSPFYVSCACNYIYLPSKNWTISANGLNGLSSSIQKVIEVPETYAKLSARANFPWGVSSGTTTFRCSDGDYIYTA